MLSTISVRFLDVSLDVYMAEGQVPLSPVAFAGISRSFRPTLPAEECLPECPVPEKRITSVESIRPEPQGPLPTTPFVDSFRIGDKSLTIPPNPARNLKSAERGFVN
jgi:hypothetical protein